MSTKIYYAAKWKGTTKELFEYLNIVREKYFENACDVFRPVADDLKSAGTNKRTELLTLIKEIDNMKETF